MAIYAANGSVPGALVATSGTGTLVANSWNTVPISATLAPATSYYLGYNTNGASTTVNNLRYTNGGSSGWRSAGQAYGTWPASFGGFSSQARHLLDERDLRQRRHAADRGADRTRRG